MDTMLSAVHTRATAAARRNGSTGELSDLEPPDNTPTPTSWWRKYFGEWEALTVAGKVIEKGWVVPQPLGIALILLILSGAGGMYWRMDSKVDAAMAAKAAETKAAETARQDLRDLLIRLDQRFIDKDIHDREEIQELKDRFGSVEAWQQVTNKDIVLLKQR